MRLATETTANRHSLSLNELNARKSISSYSRPPRGADGADDPRRLERREGQRTSLRLKLSFFVLLSREPLKLLSEGELSVTHYIRVITLVDAFSV